jgi:LacI family transcriptional regulator
MLSGMSARRAAPGGPPGIGLRVLRHATMRNVAALARVGKTTVSRVFNGDPTVSPEIVSRVRMAAAALNYQPNQAARDLRQRNGRPSTIGLLIPDVSNVFWATIFRAVEDMASTQDVRVLASNLDDDAARERQMVANLTSRRVSGLIMVPASLDHSYLHHQQRLGIPVVFVDRPAIQLEADSVVSDSRDGAYGAVRHLLHYGHRRIAFLGKSTAHAPDTERYEGYVQALREAGLKLDANIIERGADTEELTVAACMKFLSCRNPPTAFFAAHNRATLGALEAFAALGCERTTALIGFDDFPLFDRLKPGISVVAQDPYALGQVGTQVLFERIAGDCSPARQHVVKTRLIARGSGEIPATGASEAGQRLGHRGRPRAQLPHPLVAPT